MLDPFGRVMHELGGRVVSTPPGIDCPGACSARFTGPDVELAAEPMPGYRLEPWEGACSGAQPVCRLTLKTEVTTVVAVFVQKRTCECEKIGVKVSGLGAGRISGGQWKLQFRVGWAITCSEGVDLDCKGKVAVRRSTKAVALTAPEGSAAAVSVSCQGRVCAGSNSGSFLVRAGLSRQRERVRFRVSGACAGQAPAKVYLVTFAFRPDGLLDRKKSGVALTHS